MVGSFHQKTPVNMDGDSSINTSAYTLTTEGIPEPNRWRCDINLKETIKRRIPVVEWLPRYKIATFLQDLLAGFTVGLTEIPQGIAYAVVAGLPPVYGLYSGFMGCFMYFLFGSCKDINIGPTAIMALMAKPHVDAMGPDMAVLLTFLSGCVIFVLGLFHLGFLVEFFSYPVIAGFTSAAAFNIASSQINGLLGLTKKADSFLETWKLAFENIKDTRPWDATLGIISIIVLVLMKEMRRYGSLKHRPEWSTQRNIIGKTIFFFSLARNAIVVIIGTIIAYCLSKEGKNPFLLTKSVKGGLPPFEPPPFSTHGVNGTDNYDFGDMSKEFGSTIAFAPLVAILESIAIAKAFSKGKSLDATQELLALGVCNIMGSFVRSMPVTGSFTRTAVNNASGVKTPLGGIITGILVLLALQFLTSAFYYIPKATLASVVICAMFYLFDFQAFTVLWKSKRLDLIPFLVTLILGLLLSLEYGILIGIAVNLIFVLYSSARPKVEMEKLKLPQGEVLLVTSRISPQFPAAEFIRETVLAQCDVTKPSMVVINGVNFGNTDATVAKSFSVLFDELKLKNQKLLFWNFKPFVRDVFIGNNRDLTDCFRTGTLEDIVCDHVVDRNGENFSVQL